MSIIYLPSKFQLHRLINNGDLLADRILWKDTLTHRLNLILSPYNIIGSSKNLKSCEKVRKLQFKMHSKIADKSFKVWDIIWICVFTSPGNRESVNTFPLALCLCLSVSGQNSSRTNALIWTQFSLNGCSPLWVGLY